jgi:hypothetical protein
MTVDRVREIRAWATVLAGTCEDYVHNPTEYSGLILKGAIRNLAEAMDRALSEELSTPSEEKTVPQVQ